MFKGSPAETTNEAEAPIAPSVIYGRNTEDKKMEYFDDQKTLDRKLDLLAEWVKKSSHCMIFTGAGISTSTGIPDYRSGLNTVLKTGPGAWELKDKGIAGKKAPTAVLTAVPSMTHMSIVKLQEAGYVSFVVSQNVDGLHLRSGLNPNFLAELHGNTNLERCVRCGQEYLRDYRTRKAEKVTDHLTGRRCEVDKCDGFLVDSIVNFGERLPERYLELASDHAEKSDLCICMGSSLTVSPANGFPEIVAQRGKRLVICNLQKTPLHSVCDLAIHALCDVIATGLMQRLEIPIQKWKLKRRVRLSMRPSEDGVNISVAGLDVFQDLPYSLFKNVVLKNNSNEFKSILTKEPFTEQIPVELAKGDVSIEMFFHGHYAETPAVITAEIVKESTSRDFLMEYDFEEKSWTIK